MPSCQTSTQGAMQQQTIKSNHKQLEGGPGLRVGIVPAAPDCAGRGRGPTARGGLWLAVLPDPDGFMGLFNDAYWCVASAIYTIGKHERPPYYLQAEHESP